MELSIVTTLYQSATYLRRFYERSVAAAERLSGDFELILVNDGSSDESLEIAKSLLERDPRIRIVDLSRNFGHHRAILTGLAHAKGDLVFLIDCDLEEEPELLGEFHRLLLEKNADVVYGVQQSRKGGSFERISGDLFYRCFNRLSYYPIPHNLVTAKLMKRAYVAELVRYDDPEVFLAGYWQLPGFLQVPATVHKLDKGTSVYTLGRKVAFFVDAVTSFSAKPLVFMFYLGLVLMVLSALGIVYLVARSIFWGDLLMGWPSLMLSIWLLGGTTIFCLGTLGLYLSKIFAATKRRPYSVVRQVYAREGGNHG